jgi:hypothetical protein
MFQSPVTQIAIDPTNYLIVSSEQGEVEALSIVQKEVHYVYLDLGKKQYCTVALPQNKDVRAGENETLLHKESGTLFCI